MSETTATKNDGKPSKSTIALGRAIWSQKLRESGDKLTGEQRKARWQEERRTYVKMADQIDKMLKANGFAVSEIKKGRKV